jgi:hypothetical protein
MSCIEGSNPSNSANRSKPQRRILLGLFSLGRDVHRNRVDPVCLQLDRQRHLEGKFSESAWIASSAAVIESPDEPSGRKRVKAKLILFLVTFPFSLWLMEMLVRWALDDKEANSFLGPAIASAALGLIGPAAVPRDEPSAGNIFAIDRGNARRGQHATYAGLLGIPFGMLGWLFCLVVSIKRSLPAGMLKLMTLEGWQFAVAIGMYVVAVFLTMWKESA